MTAGNDTLNVKAANSCGNGANQTLPVTVSVAVNTNPDNPYGIVLMPNPSKGDIYLKASHVINKTISIVIMNPYGQIVYRDQQVAAINNYLQLFRLGKLAAGIYMVKIAVDEEKYVRSILRIN